MFNSKQLILFMIIIEIHTLLAVKTYAKQNSTAQQEGKLVLAQVISRHGNRTIVQTYKTDPYQSIKYWPEGFGNLTKIGNKTEEDFGKFLRKRYTKLIGLFGSRHKVQVESGGDSRVANSAAKGSKGLFPVTSLLKDKTTHVIPKQHDYFLKPSFECRRFVQLYDQYNLSPQIQSQLQQITPFRKYVESYSQTPLEKTMDFYKFYDSLMIESKRGLKLPLWVQRIWPSALDTFEYFSSLAMSGFTSSIELKKMNAGFLLRLITNRFKQFRSASLQNLESTIPRRLWLTYGHDATIINIMNALGVFTKPHIPPFGSSFHFEMFKRANGEYYIQLFYRHDKSEDMPPIYVPYCGTQCPLDRFIALYQNIFPADTQTYQSMCAAIGI